MPGGAEDGDDEDPTIVGESKKRFKSDHRHMKEWKESMDESKRLKPNDEIKTRPNQDKETLYVHLVAHTHDDVGWIKTVD